MKFKDFIDRYGLALGVVAALTLVLALLPGNASDRQVDTGFDEDSFASGETGSAGGGVGASGGRSSGGGGGDSGGGSRTGGGSSRIGGASGSGPSEIGDGSGPAAGGPGGPGAGPAGDPGQVLWGKGPCRPDGRQAGISRYMPPCVQWTGTDNGGSTFQGVTRDKIIVVRWIGQLDPGTHAILEGANLSDDPETIKRSYNTILRYANLHHQTWGREVVFVEKQASGKSTSDEAMRKDALEIADEIKPFAVMTGDPAEPIPPVLAKELVRRGILCICAGSAASEFFTSRPPLMFGSLPTMDEYAANAAEYISEKMLGKPAKFAGDDVNPAQQMRGKTRKFGLIALEGREGRVYPEAIQARDVLIREFERRGIKFAAKVGYLYEPGRNQQDVTNLIATMKREGVTTIVPMWDPLYPILITKEASNQQYFPEWFILGTGLSDTTTAGRLYDQLQWRHAFGISPLWITWQTLAKSGGYREYHHLAPPGARPGDEGVLVNIYRAGIQTLMRGIHMAGPTLTNETFVSAQFAFPPTGGTPGAPLVFLTREFPTEIKDFTEVWYDYDRHGPDEREEQGDGMIMKAAGGRRYRPGQWSGPSLAFVDNGAIAVSDNPPGGGDPPHEQDGHKHPPDQRCLSC